MQAVMYLLPVLLVSMLTSTAWGQEVSAAYISATGPQITLQLTVKKPAPQNIIVEQYLPPGTKVLSTTPKAKQAGARNGAVKWLLRGIKPGKLVVAMKVSPPLSTKPQGKLTYRNPKDGSLMERSF